MHAVNSKNISQKKAVLFEAVSVEQICCSDFQVKAALINVTTIALQSLTYVITNYCQKFRGILDKSPLKLEQLSVVSSHRIIFQIE